MPGENGYSHRSANDTLENKSFFPDPGRIPVGSLYIYIYIHKNKGN